MKIFLLLAGVCCDYCTEPVPSLATYKAASAGFVPTRIAVLFRHGDRTPEKIPRDFDLSKWSCVSTKERRGSGKEYRLLSEDKTCKPGSLTSAGCRQLLSLGRALHRIYAKHTPLVRGAFDVKTRTTSIERTRASALCFLRGLLPEQNAFRMGSHSLDSDTLIETHSDIGRRLRQKILKESDKAFLKKIAKHGQESPFMVRDVYMASLCRKNGQGEPSLPSEYKVIAEKVTRHSLETEKILAGNKEYAKSISSPLLKDVLRQLEEAKQKMSIFSAHDTTIYIVLIGLGIKIDAWPGYNANFIFERGALDGRDVARMLLNGEKVVPAWTGTDKNGFFLFSELQKYIEAK